MNKMLLKSVTLVCVLFAATGHADEGIKYSGTGFMTVGAGKMLGGTRANVTSLNCPCAITDYAQGGYYDGSNNWQSKADSKLGLQGIASYNNFSITSQIVARTATEAANLEWLYASYILNDSITLKAGRQRLPMFYYSEAQDVGYALPWTHLPGFVYGWEVVNYNGASMKYQDQFGDWLSTINLFGGEERNKNSPFWKVEGNGLQSITDVKWSNIRGANMTLTKDWFEGRVVYITNNTQEQPVNNIWDSTTSSYDIAPTVAPIAQQEVYGLAVKANYKNWLLISEVIQLNHPGLTYNEHDQYVSVGYRYNNWLPMLRWENSYTDERTNGILPNAAPYSAWSLINHTLSLRYTLSTSSDVKVEYDHLINNSYWGESKLLTFAYDKVF